MTATTKPKSIAAQRKAAEKEPITFDHKFRPGTTHVQRGPLTLGWVGKFRTPTEGQTHYFSRYGQGTWVIVLTATSYKEMKEKVVGYYANGEPPIVNIMPLRPGSGGETQGQVEFRTNPNPFPYQQSLARLQGRR